MELSEWSRRGPPQRKTVKSGSLRQSWVASSKPDWNKEIFPDYGTGQVFNLRPRESRLKTRIDLSGLAHYKICRKQRSVQHRGCTHPGSARSNSAELKQLHKKTIDVLIIIFCT